MTKLDG